MRGLGAGNVLVQPRDRGTSPGLLLALLHVFDRDPSAIVIVLPSEHSVQDERGLRQALRKAALQASRLPGAVTLVGRPPRLGHPDPLWIVPCFADDDCSRILQLVESPTEERARELHGSGGLTPPLVMVGMARSFLDLFDAAAPSLLRAFLRAARSGPLMQDGRPGRPLQELHEHLEASDFSRDVLPRTEIRDLLRVARVPPRGFRGSEVPKSEEAGWRWGRKRDLDLRSCE